MFVFAGLSLQLGFGAEIVPQREEFSTPSSGQRRGP